MCVGTAARVASIKGDEAIIITDGASRKINSSLIEDLLPGDYVMVHAGTAIAKITNDDENESEEVIRLL